MNENNKSKLIIIIVIVLLIVAILAVVRLFNFFGGSKVNDSEREAFKEEIQKIYNNVSDNVNETLIASSPIGDTYCKKSADLTAVDLTCPTDSKELNIETSKSYLIITDSNGIVNYISVADNEYVYGKTGVLSSDEIKKEHIYKTDDTKVKDKFVMIYGVTPEGKINTTDNSNK